MFCTKCGAKLEDDAQFCVMCGEPVAVEEQSAPQQKNTAVQQEQTPVWNQVPPSERIAPKKKKSKLPFLVVGVLALMLIVAAVFILTADSDEVYIDSLQGYYLYDDMSYTCKEVVDKYIQEPAWTLRKEDDAHYVDIEGKVIGTNHQVKFTVNVEKDPDDSDMMLFEAISSKVDGEEIFGEVPPSYLWRVMYFAFDENCKDLSAAFAQLDLMADENGSQLSRTVQVGTQGSSVTLYYPDTWQEMPEYMDDTTLVAYGTPEECPSCLWALVTISEVSSGESPMADLMLLYLDDETFAQEIDINASEAEIATESLDGVTAKKVACTDEDGIYQSTYFYHVDTELYAISIFCADETIASFYENLMDNIIDKFEIADDTGWSQEEYDAYEDALEIFCTWLYDHPSISSYYMSMDPMNMFTDTDVGRYYMYTFYFGDMQNTLYVNLDTGDMIMGYDAWDDYYGSYYNTVPIEDWYNNMTY